MYGFQIYSLRTFRSALIIYYIRWCHKENLTGGGNQRDLKTLDTTSKSIIHLHVNLKEVKIKLYTLTSSSTTHISQNMFQISKL